MKYVKSAGIITTPLTSTSDFSVLRSNVVPQSATQSSQYGRNGTMNDKDTTTMYSSMFSLTYKLEFALGIIQSRRSDCAIVLFLATRYFPCRIR